MTSTPQDLEELDELDAADVTRVYAAALADRKHLHTFRSCMISWEDLEPALRRNPHIIKCILFDEISVPNYLHCNRVSQSAAHCLHLFASFDLGSFFLLQIARWNWSRVVLALSFARSIAPMAFALRYSVLPLIDSIVQLAFDKGVEKLSIPFSPYIDEIFTCEDEIDLQRSAISLQSFTRTTYFETELQCHSKLKRKTFDA